MSLIFDVLILVTFFFFTENVALNKPAFQQYPYNGGGEQFGASNGVDGRKSDLSNVGGQCVLSANGKQTALWWVNLTSIYNIYNITIYYRTDNVPWRTYMFDSVRNENNIGFHKIFVNYNLFKVTIIF